MAPPSGPWLTVTLLALRALLSSCTGADGHSNVGEKSPETVRLEQVARKAWPEWASSQLEEGTGPLLRARGRLQGNDWGVADRFVWELTFRTDRPSPAVAVLSSVRRACDFAPGRTLGNQSVTARLMLPGTSAPVPAVLQTDCEDGFDRLAPWLTHLEQHALPAEVRGSTIHVQDAPDDVLMLFVPSSGVTRAAVVAIVRHHCASAGRSALSMTIRSSDRPEAAGESGTSSYPVAAPPCRAVVSRAQGAVLDPRAAPPRPEPG